MSALWTLCCTAVFAAAEPVDTQFVQVSPVSRAAALLSRSEGQVRAVVLLPGISPHPFSTERVAQARWQDWQQAGSTLVEILAREADVFAFAYSQNEAIERIAESPGLADNIRRLKELGYREIVLVGHSAGGLIARHFVEDRPDAGVTRVVQVCTPNAGTIWGRFRLGVREPQEKYLASLSKRGRNACLAQRAGKGIPKGVEFVCVVGQAPLPERVTFSLELPHKKQATIVLRLDGLRGDGLVSAGSQWPHDLQEQGIPAHPLRTTHFTVMQSRAAAQVLADLVREKQPRWDAARIEKARRTILGESDEEP
jgi:hypothetical protein